MGLGLIGAIGGFGKGLSDTAQRNFDEEKEMRIREWEMKKLMAGHELDMQKQEASQAFSAEQNKLGRDATANENALNRQATIDAETRKNNRADDMRYGDEVTIQTAVAEAGGDITLAADELIKMGKPDLAKKVLESDADYQTGLKAASASGSKYSQPEVIRNEKGEIIGSTNRYGEFEWSTPEATVSLPGIGPVKFKDLEKFMDRDFNGNLIEPDPVKWLKEKFGIDLAGGVGQSNVREIVDSKGNKIKAIIQNGRWVNAETNQPL